MTERDLQDAVIDCARSLGYRVAHFRPALTAKGWRTPVQGDGKGFPDLVLAHARQRRLLFMELKAGRGKLSVDQVEWLDTLTDTESCEVYSFWDRDWLDGTIESVLRASPYLDEPQPCARAKVEGSRARG